MVELYIMQDSIEHNEYVLDDFSYVSSQLIISFNIESIYYRPLTRLLWLKGYELKSISFDKRIDHDCAVPLDTYQQLLEIHKLSLMVNPKQTIHYKLYPSNPSVDVMLDTEPIDKKEWFNLAHEKYFKTGD